MQKLTIITVGYNEENNLPKLFKSLEYIKSKIEIRHIYVDQNSQDKSLQTAKINGCETYLHENKGYADPDKKWALENLCNDEDWCFIMDCDDEFSKKLSDEIIDSINNNSYLIYKIPRDNIWLNITTGVAYEPRLFMKKGMGLNTQIHYYFSPKTDKIGKLKTPLIGINNKDIGNYIKNLTEKSNRYSEEEIKIIGNIGKYKIIFNLFWKPILWFFGFGIRHKHFTKGISGIILCSLMAYYQFIIYAKLYEKYYITNNKNE